MIMDQVQVVSLILEIIGFGLAAFQIYHAGYRESSDWFFNALKSFTTIENRPYGILLQADYDFETDEEKEMAVQSNMFSILVCVVLLPVLTYYIDFGEGLLWLFLEIPTILILMILLFVPAQILIHIALSLFIRAYIYLSTMAGKGDRIGGIGLTLAVIGILLETIQVWYGPFRFAIYWVWGPILFAITFAGVMKYKKG